MSILMEALKQQTQNVSAQADNSIFWRKLALVLALLLAMAIGAAGAFYIMVPNQVTPALTNNTPVVAPAQAENILASLVSTQEKALSPLPELTQQIGGVLVPEVEPVKEVFTQAAPIKMVTANEVVEPSLDAIVSDALKDKFASALQATSQNEAAPVTTTVRTHNAPAIDIYSLDAKLQQQIPALKFDAHVYATSVSQRWVKVNGKTLQEGQWITADIKIKEITSQYVLLELGSQLFSMKALTEWPAS